MSYLEGLMGEDEHVMVTAHRHPLFLIGHLALYVIAALVLIGVGSWVATTDVTIWLSVALWVISLIPLGFAVLRFVAWNNEVYAITNRRIVQIEGVFTRKVFDSSLEMINDVLLSQSLVGRMLNYGTIQIITGSDIGLNRLDALSAPFTFKRALVDAKNALADRGHFPPVEDRQTQLLAALEDLRSSGLLTEAEYEIKRARVTSGRAE